MIAWATTKHFEAYTHILPVKKKGTESFQQPSVLLNCFVNGMYNAML